jgi:HAD superfamily hydrolase (TIGR01549 family)
MTSRFPQAKWIFFDVGYTLLDETPAWDDRFAAMAQHLGASVAPAQIWQTFRSVCEEFEPKQWIAVCRRLEHNEHERERLVKLGEAWRHELQRPYPRAAESLAALASSGYKLGIIANQWLGIAERLRMFGLAEHISVCIGSAEAGVVKPDRRIFEMALREARCEAREAVMVGDRIDNDVRPAKSIGMGTIHVRQGTSGKQRPREASETPDVSVDTLAEVAPVIGVVLAPPSS